MCEVTDPGGLDWWESANRIAIHTAATHPSVRYLSHEERIDAALDAIVQHVHEHGWPGTDLGPVFRAAANGVEHATYQYAKHIGRGNYWVEPPGAPDAIAEAVTDKLGVVQLCWVFTPAEWEVIWALTEVMPRGGGYREAAALIGKTPSVVSSLLATARRRARGYWVAPGETPPGNYGPDRGRLRTVTTPRDSRKQRRYQNRKRARQAA